MIQSRCASRAVHFDPSSSSIDYELRLIDISNQNLTALPPLVVENSDKVEHLILDGNNFTEYFLNTTFSNLRTLSLNTNRIRDVAFLLQLLAKRCPKLSFLSLIGNPGWPHQFSITDVRLYKEYTEKQLYYTWLNRFAESLILCTGDSLMEGTKNGSRANDTIIKSTDMDEEMQQEAIRIASIAVHRFNVERDVATFVKEEFDKKYTPSWHCVVGRNFGSYVTHESNHFIYFYLKHLAIMLFKTAF